MEHIHVDGVLFLQEADKVLKLESRRFVGEFGSSC